MAFVSPLQGHIDVALSNFAVKFRNPAYVSDQVFTRVPVQRQSDKYWRFGKEQLQALIDDLRAPGAAAQRVTQTLSAETYFAEDHALERLITDEERANFDAGDVEQWVTETLTDKLLLRKEKLFAAAVTDTAQVTQNVTLSGTAQWSDFTNSTPTENIQTGQETIAQNAGVRANTLILGFPVFSKLRNHPKVVERVQNIRVGVVREEDLASIFDVQRVLVSQALEVDAAGNVGFVFGKHAVLAYVSPTPAFGEPSFGKTFVWAGAPGSTNGFIVELGRATPVSRKADELAVHFYYDQKITAVEAAYLIEDAVA
ncbi:MAG: major capsid protein [Acidobacteria bacterium]|nr:major capsid protein [Acidobacteriota bacterium]